MCSKLRTPVFYTIITARAKCYSSSTRMLTTQHDLSVPTATHIRLPNLTIIVTGGHFQLASLVKQPRRGYAIHVGRKVTILYCALQAYSDTSYVSSKTKYNDDQIVVGSVLSEYTVQERRTAREPDKQHADQQGVQCTFSHAIDNLSASTAGS